LEKLTQDKERMPAQNNPLEQQKLAA